MNVNEMTIMGWELNQCQPLVRHLPRIIDFLEYVPEDLFQAHTLGQKIKRYRLLHGMTRLQLAKQLHIDEVTLDKLEKDKGRHFQETLNKVAGLLKSAG